MTMNVSEYIVHFLKEKGVKDFFGYQGTMIAYFVDAICKDSEVKNHTCYNEQGAAFAACGFAKATGKCAVAYATSGPGALNLISGIADAYYDSVPTIFITGQLNTIEYTEIKELRQQGFQQTNVVDITKPITKYSTIITEAESIYVELEKAWDIANSGRKGPVVLDIPMNIQKSEMKYIKTHVFNNIKNNVDTKSFDEICKDIINQIEKSERPILLLGNGISKGEEIRNVISTLVNKFNIPVITSMLGRDILPTNHPMNFGYIGAAYGHRYANLITYKKADLIVSMGCSLCRRQTGQMTDKFAESSTIIRIDIDPIELKRKVHKNDKIYLADVNAVIMKLLDYTLQKKFSDWIRICQLIKDTTEEFDAHCEERYPNNIMDAIGSIIPSSSIVVSDVGQHQIWVAQSLKLSMGQKLLFSGGHGAMGFALPAAIGAYYGSNRRTICISGDGAFQMNLQELQWVVRENIPVLIFVMNNSSLGLICQQQEDFFHKKYYGSIEEGGYTSPDFSRIAEGYGIEAYKVVSINEILQLKEHIMDKKPILIEVVMPLFSKAYPKTYYGQEMYNQKPYMPVRTMEYLLSL